MVKNYLKMKLNMFYENEIVHEKLGFVIYTYIHIFFFNVHKCWYHNFTLVLIFIGLLKNNLV